MTKREFRDHMKAVAARYRPVEFPCPAPPPGPRTHTIVISEENHTGLLLFTAFCSRQGCHWIGEPYGHRSEAETEGAGHLAAMRPARGRNRLRVVRAADHQVA